jgi:hypothetical protein
MKTEVSMTKQEKKRLLKQIAGITEKAYRRGFQHGHLAALGKLGAPAPTEGAIANWRFAKNSATHSVSPPGAVKHRDSLIDRLSYETRGFDLISNLIHEVENEIK